MSAWEWLWLGLVALVLVLASMVAFLAALQRFWIAPRETKAPPADYDAAQDRGVILAQLGDEGSREEEGQRALQRVGGASLVETTESLPAKLDPPRDAPDEAELELREDDRDLEPDDSDEAALEAGMSHGGVQDSTFDRVAFEDDEEGGIAR